MKLLLLVSASLVLLSACAGGPPATHTAEAAAPPRALRLRADPTKTLPTELRVLVTVENAAHERRVANGVAARGGTVRVLAHSLKSSLAHHGCKAEYHDADPAADQLPRAMQQIVVLPEGWTFVSADLEVFGGYPSKPVELSLEAGQ